MYRAHIISDIQTPRLTYICDLIFTSYLGVDYDISTDVNTTSKVINIRYGHRDKEEDSYSIRSSSLLAESSITRQHIQVDTVEGLTSLQFEDGAKRQSEDESIDLDVDLFAMVFYLLSRYEEYLETPKDQHGRYPSKESIASKHNFLHLPLVDMWIDRFAQLINERYHAGWSLTGRFDIQPTIDIDLPYAYQYKGWKKYVGIAKDIIKWNRPNQKARINNWATGKDPFNTYDWIKEACAKCNRQPIIFLLNNYKKPHDENHLAYTDHLTSIIKKLEQWADIGIHPSIESNFNQEKLKDEFDWLQDRTSSKIVKSRQHFLQLQLPTTYQRLIALGIMDDYSMMYPDQPGYRASTSRAYRWYDLSKEVNTSLTIHPSMTMDVTMRYYKSYKPEEAITNCQALIEQSNAVNGTFSFIWHNSTLSEAYGWGPWKKVFLSLIEDYKSSYGDS